MVNEFRTLLANLPGSGPAQGPGEAYSDPGYRPAALSAELRAARAALFGPRPDRRGVLLRCFQLAAMVEATELRDHAREAFDPRVSYPPLPPGLPLAAAAAARAIGGAPPLALGGTPAADASGRAAWALRVALDAVGPAAATVTIDDGVAARSLAVPVSGGAAAPVALPGGVRAAIPPGAAAGSAWRVEVLAAPDDPGAAAARLAAIGEPALLALFGAAPEGVGATWAALWRSTMPLPYRLGAAALALAARTRERLAAGGAR